MSYVSTQLWNLLRCLDAIGGKKIKSCLRFQWSSSLYSWLICQLYTKCLNSPEMSFEKSHIITALVDYAAITKLFWCLCLGCAQVINLMWCGQFAWFQFALYLYLKAHSMHRRHCCWALSSFPLGGTTPESMPRCNSLTCPTAMRMQGPPASSSLCTHNLCLGQAHALDSHRCEGIIQA